MCTANPSCQLKDRPSTGATFAGVEQRYRRAPLSPLSCYPFRGEAVKIRGPRQVLGPYGRAYEPTRHLGDTCSCTGYACVVHSLPGTHYILL
jgi:hypothetical protein